MIKRFSSRSNLFVVKPFGNGCEFSWLTSLDLSQFKYMAILEIYSSSWATDGKHLCHLSSNLTDSSECNPAGHIHTWAKKPIPHYKGCITYSAININFILEFHVLDRDYTDEVKFFAENLKFSSTIEVEIIVEFVTDDI